MKVGDNVIFISDKYIAESGEIGVIESIQDSYYIVKIGDTKVKCLYTDIQKLEDPAPNTITITREDFEEAVQRVITPSVYVDDINDYGTITALCLSGEIVCKKLAKELFNDND